MWFIHRTVLCESTKMYNIYSVPIFQILDIGKLTMCSFFLLLVPLCRTKRVTIFCCFPILWPYTVHNLQRFNFNVRSVRLLCSWDKFKAKIFFRFLYKSVTIRMCFSFRFRLSVFLSFPIWPHEFSNMFAYLGFTRLLTFFGIA